MTPRVPPRVAAEALRRGEVRREAGTTAGAMQRHSKGRGLVARLYLHDSSSGPARGWLFNRLPAPECKRALVPVLLAFAILGCTDQAEPARFAATISPLRAVVEPVAGAPVSVLVPGGGSPHTYEPKPSDARRAARAAIVFYGSAELDGWAATLDTGQRVALLDLLPDSVRRPVYRGRGTDPHFWMDPRAVQAVLPGLVGVLCRQDASACAAYRQNARAFATELEVVHDSLRTLMAPSAGASVLLSHAFLTYFADRYGLRVVAVVEELAGSEPSPRDVQRMIETARASKARALFTQPLHSSRMAETIAEAAGIPVVELDPIGAADQLPALLYDNARRIRDALIAPPAL